MRQTSHPYVDLDLISDQIDTFQVVEDFDLVQVALKPDYVFVYDDILETTSLEATKSSGLNSWNSHGSLMDSIFEEEVHSN